MRTGLVRGGVVSALFLFCTWTVSGQNSTMLDEKIHVAGKAGGDSVPDWMRSLDDMNGQEIRALAAVLSGGYFAGRGTGSSGFNGAAEWVAMEMRKRGLVPVSPDGSYYQHFKVSNDEIRRRVYGDIAGSDSSSTMNVVGIRPGVEDSVHREYVVLTAHLDHLGAKGDTIFPGANDNASGVAVMLRVAQHLQTSNTRLKRSVIFVAFSGEEVGLKGSEFFVRNPLVPLHRIKALINLDLVGSGRDGFMFQGSEKWPYHESAMSEINREYFGFEMKTRPNSPNSDHYYFNAAGVPAFFIYAYNGTIPYHSPDDTADKLDAGVLENVAKLVLVAVVTFANSDEY